MARPETPNTLVSKSSTSSCYGRNRGFHDVPALAELNRVVYIRMKPTHGRCGGNDQRVHTATGGFWLFITTKKTLATAKTPDGKRALAPRCRNCKASLSLGGAVISAPEPRTCSREYAEELEGHRPVCFRHHGMGSELFGRQTRGQPLPSHLVCPLEIPDWRPLRIRFRVGHPATWRTYDQAEAECHASGGARLGSVLRFLEPGRDPGSTWRGERFHIHLPALDALPLDSDSRRLA